MTAPTLDQYIFTQDARLSKKGYSDPARITSAVGSPIMVSFRKGDILEGWTTNAGNGEMWIILKDKDNSGVYHILLPAANPMAKFAQPPVQLYKRGHAGVNDMPMPTPSSPIATGGMPAYRFIKAWASPAVFGGTDTMIENFKVGDIVYGTPVTTRAAIQCIAAPCPQGGIKVTAVNVRVKSGMLASVPIEVLEKVDSIPAPVRNGYDYSQLDNTPSFWSQKTLDIENRIWAGGIAVAIIALAIHHNSKSKIQNPK